jgi:hypothetical protein
MRERADEGNAPMNRRIGGQVEENRFSEGGASADKWKGTGTPLRISTFFFARMPFDIMYQ